MNYPQMNSWIVDKQPTWPNGTQRRLVVIFIPIYGILCWHRYRIRRVAVKTDKKIFKREEQILFKKRHICSRSCLLYPVSIWIQKNFSIHKKHFKDQTNQIWSDFVTLGICNPELKLLTLSFFIEDYRRNGTHSKKHRSFDRLESKPEFSFTAAFIINEKYKNRGRF